MLSPLIDIAATPAAAITLPPLPLRCRFHADAAIYATPIRWLRPLMLMRCHASRHYAITPYVVISPLR